MIGKRGRWDVVWAVETRADGMQLTAPAEQPEPDPAEQPAGAVDATGPTSFRYLPSSGVAVGWHPYLSRESGAERRFVQCRVADLSVRPIATRPGPRSRMLRDPAPGPTDPAHQIPPAAISRAGIRLERRYMLGRRVDGQPILWVQRRRTPLTAPPASQLRFDVVQELLPVNPMTGTP